MTKIKKNREFTPGKTRPKTRMFHLGSLSLICKEAKAISIDVYTFNLTMFNKDKILIKLEKKNEITYYDKIFSWIFNVALDFYVKFMPMCKSR